MPTLEDAILMAVEAHRGQKDKAGAAYILHPLRVMLYMETETEMMVAVLHDVIEDTKETKKVTIEYLKEAGYSEEVLQAIDCLTRRDGEEYDQFILRVKPNLLARKVKIADLEDNINLERIADTKEDDFKRAAKYRRALAELMKI
jgi:(p)ppGpp synthase/HD superfamily hydrolase